MPESDRKTAALVGLFLFIGLVLLGGLIVQFGRFGDRFAQKYPLTVVFADAAGIIEGSEVRMGGARIGKVADTPTLTEDVKVEVPLAIDERIRIPEGSMFQIASATLLGDKLIVVTPPAEPTGNYIEPETTLGGGGPSGLEAIQNNAEALSRDADQLLISARETMRNIDAAVGDIREATRTLNETLGRINEAVLSEENLAHLDATFANLDEASGAIGPAVVEVRAAATSARETFATVNEKLAKLDPALEEIPEAVTSISSAADRAAATLERVEQGEGLLGTLTNDTEVSEDAKTFIRNLRQQGILRYRDAEMPEDDPRTRYRGRRR